MILKAIAKVAPTIETPLEDQIIRPHTLYRCRMPEYINTLPTYQMGIALLPPTGFVRLARLSSKEHDSKLNFEVYIDRGMVASLHILQPTLLFPHKLRIKHLDVDEIDLPSERVQPELTGWVLVAVRAGQIQSGDPPPPPEMIEELRINLPVLPAEYSLFCKLYRDASIGDSYTLSGVEDISPVNIHGLTVLPVIDGRDLGGMYLVCEDASREGEIIGPDGTIEYKSLSEAVSSLAKGE